jgi:putative restriction endonuclease
MSRRPDERPPGWRVGERLWSPQRKEDGNTWGFWETMLEVNRGDIVFHLCGGTGDADFTGFSIAAEDGQAINEGPEGSDQLYCVRLRDYSKFEDPISWETIRLAKRDALLQYFERNRSRTLSKERLFYVLQRGRLQCLNGAYLSFLSDDLIEILFGFRTNVTESNVAVASTAPVGSTLRTAAFRVGQQKFSDNVKANFHNCCCFPGCPVADRRFLIGSHIARWRDASRLRGETKNGLCLCVFHDRAFEIGAFTFDADLKVQLHNCDYSADWVKILLAKGAGKKIKDCEILPTKEMLAHHWRRHGIEC